VKKAITCDVEALLAHSKDVAAGYDDVRWTRKWHQELRNLLQIVGLTKLQDGGILASRMAEYDNKLAMACEQIDAIAHDLHALITRLGPTETRAPSTPPQDGAEPSP